MLGGTIVWLIGFTIVWLVRGIVMLGTSFLSSSCQHTFVHLLTVKLELPTTDNETLGGCCTRRIIVQNFAQSPTGHGA